MKNKISDLRNHMFAALEWLGSEDLKPEELRSEIERCKAISEVGKVIVESAKTEVLYAKLTRNKEAEPTAFLEIEDKKKLQRPPAVYDNKSN